MNDGSRTLILWGPSLCVYLYYFRNKNSFGIKSSQVEEKKASFFYFARALKSTGIGVVHTHPHTMVPKVRAHEHNPFLGPYDTRLR